MVPTALQQLAEALRCSIALTERAVAHPQNSRGRCARKNSPVMADVTEYELQRQRRVQDNRRKMEELGLMEASRGLMGAAGAVARVTLEAGSQQQPRKKRRVQPVRGMAGGTVKAQCTVLVSCWVSGDFTQEPMLVVPMRALP